MQSYFHYNVRKDRRRLRSVLVLIIAPLFQACLLAMLTLIFSLSCVEETGGIILLGGTVCVCVLVGMLLCWGWYELISCKIAANSRYTYFDILPKTLIYSRYSGSRIVNGRRCALRTLYAIPLKSLGEVTVSGAAKNKGTLEISGEIRRYLLDSEQLGYHIVDGEAVFDRWWLEHGAFETIKRIKIPCIFGGVKRLSHEIETAKKRYDEIPPPRPHIFKEADYIRRRPKPRVMPENLSYNRKW